MRKLENAVGCWPPESHPAAAASSARHSASDMDCSHSLIRAGTQCKLAAEPHPSRHVQITARLLTFCLPQAKQRQGTEVVTVDMLPVISQPACASM